MQYSLCLITLFVSSLSFADGRWEVVSEDRAAGDTPEKILQVLNLDGGYETSWLRINAVNRQLAGLPVEVIKKIELTTTHYHWSGDTTCSPNDPRLDLRNTEGEICYWGHGSSSSCTAWSPSMPSNEDPCLNSN